MPKFISSYVIIVDSICDRVGRFVMYGVFLMMFLLILSFVTRNIINFPLMWIIEMAQFTITAYYLLGGGYSMLADDHVRMDLFYGKLSKKGKAKMDIFTSFFLIFYLAILFFGSFLQFQCCSEQPAIAMLQDSCISRAPSQSQWHDRFYHSQNIYKFLW